MLIFVDIYGTLATIKVEQDAGALEQFRNGEVRAILGDQFLECDHDQLPVKVGKACTWSGRGGGTTRSLRLPLPLR